ncbi:uncharacterized protein LOC124409426 [Diprion similis]|uniref:uncharacterized protein LOC124409426 n=1 Tax=Diprion similis TaxID=362088 RepID=UPI001EF96B63|nr:uncharacterized protein LOC124409426 [Diprion similis]
MTQYHFMRKYNHIYDKLYSIQITRRMQFPKNLLSRQAWIKFVDIPNWEPNDNTRLCSKHFAENCFDRSGKIVRLVDAAIPTIRIERLKYVRNMPVEVQIPVPQTDFSKYTSMVAHSSDYMPSLNENNQACTSFAGKDITEENSIIIDDINSPGPSDS